MASNPPSPPFPLKIILSPDAVESEYCEREVNYAAEHCKRFIPLLHRELKLGTLPTALAKINWIDFQTQSFEQALPELIQTIELDRDHARQHTILQQRATEWEENGRSQDFLLNSAACDKAEQWLVLAQEKQPVSTKLQQTFIAESRTTIIAAARKYDSFLERSALSKLNFRVYRLQLVPSITHFHLPINATLFTVGTG